MKFRITMSVLVVVVLLIAAAMLGDDTPSHSTSAPQDQGLTIH